jgi:hypothetical protein
MEVRQELLGGASLTCAELHDSQDASDQFTVPSGKMPRERHLTSGVL